MDVRVYVALQHAIDTAISVADLETVRVLLDATQTDARERHALGRRLRDRERELRPSGGPAPSRLPAECRPSPP